MPCLVQLKRPSYPDRTVCCLSILTSKPPPVPSNTTIIPPVQTPHHILLLSSYLSSSFLVFYFESLLTISNLPNPTTLLDPLDQNFQRNPDYFLDFHLSQYISPDWTHVLSGLLPCWSLSTTPFPLTSTQYFRAPPDNASNSPIVSSTDDLSRT